MAGVGKNIATVGAGAALVAAGAGAASAADVTAFDTDAVDWTGFYVGGAAGMVLGGQFPTNYDNDYDAADDFIYGGFLGYNHQIGDFVVGMEVAVQSGFDGEGDGDTDDYEVNHIFDSKFKLGFALDPVLLYALGGISLVDAYIEHPDADYSFGAANFGLGAAWMATEHLSLGAEVLGRYVPDAHGVGGYDSEDQTHWQGMLRAAFHF